MKNSRYLTLLPLLISCANPLQSTKSDLFIDQSLQSAYDLANYKAPKNVKFIIKGVLPFEYSAYFNGIDTIKVNQDRQFSSDATLAALLAHEIHHAYGYKHDCADGIRDRALNGPWSKQIEVLIKLGENKTAEQIRNNEFCN